MPMSRSFVLSLHARTLILPATKAWVSSWWRWISPVWKFARLSSSPVPANSMKCSSTTPSVVLKILSVRRGTVGKWPWAYLASNAVCPTLGQQMLFQNELDEIVRAAKANGAAQDPVIRQRIADAHVGLRIMRYNSMRMLSGGGDDGSSPADGSLQKEAMIYKLYWATWHRNLGKLAMDVLGPEAEICEAARTS